MQIVPLRFCHIGTMFKRSVFLWPSKYAKIRFLSGLRPGLRPGPRWGNSRRSPDPLVVWEGDTRCPCVLHNSSQIYMYAFADSRKFTDGDCFVKLCQNASWQCVGRAQRARRIIIRRTEAAAVFGTDETGCSKPITRHAADWIERVWQR